MNLNKFSEEVYQNAVEHGFWEDDRDITVSAALIHSEWSEALEEFRAGRPMVWYNCNEISTDLNPCNPQDEGDCLNYDCQETCKYRSKKPEGIAVELIDGCIRILDVFGRYGYKCNIPTVNELADVMCTANPKLSRETTLPELVCLLHNRTARAVERTVKMDTAQAIVPLQAALGFVFYWLRENGVDAEEIMLIKHMYNKTRPYKHGKKF